MLRHFQTGELWSKVGKLATVWPAAVLLLNEVKVMQTIPSDRNSVPKKSCKNNKL